ncbi:MAG TPA: hypothetical protein VNT00_07315 [Eoetvoesiella sp.]|uniref:hypothetical protein n=1 Tax=Eoetvoesiella sp. TaxID=1966355 RepID=UPI002C46EF31|nr:hypothetical protein [Eoetvoesiella sp.]HWK61212.1 hypothetical protein [Eoetvoesiella sp.]
MKTLYLLLRPVLAAVACASISACANNPPQQTDLAYRSRPSSTAQNTNNTSGPSGQRLTIRAGEGERLNLPWFVRDTQDWINSN